MAIELQLSLAGAAYLERHHMKESLAEMVELIARDMPEDPWATLSEMIHSHLQGLGVVVQCENPWCEMKVPTHEYELHKKTCRADKWTKCIRCDARVETSRMQQHRANCQMVACSQCGEYVFPRMVNLCPLGILKQVHRRRCSQQSSMMMASVGSNGSRTRAMSPGSNSDVFTAASISAVNNSNTTNNASLTLLVPSARGKSSDVSPKDSGALKSLQSLWRRRRARSTFSDLAFQAIWNLMEFARETKLTRGVSAQRLYFGAEGTNHRSAGLEPHSPTTKSLMSFLRKGSVDTHHSPVTPSVNLPTDVERITKEYTEKFCSDIFHMIDDRDVVEFSLATKIVTDATKMLSLRPVVMHVSCPNDGEVVVVGDLHGQLKDLLHIMHHQGNPGPHQYFVFNGDFVDRGPYGMEVLLYIYVLLCAYPEYVHINRGNHEDLKSNCEYGFQEEIMSKYDDDGKELMETLIRSFKAMPLITVIDKKVAVLHGGVPRHIVTLDRIANVGKVKDIPTVEQVDEDDEILCDILWSDPVDRFKSRNIGMRHQGENWRTSARGCGIEYLEPHTDAFLALNGLEMIVRSHEMVAAGYEVCHQGRCVTVFSASDYCGVSGNRAAIAIFKSLSYDPIYHTWFIKQDVSDELDLESSFIPFQQVGGGGGTSVSFDGDADPSDTKACGAPAAACDDGRPGVQHDCIQQIRELIWVKRYELMSHFSGCDAEQNGFVSKVEWCEVVRKVLELNDLPWYYLCPYVADVVIFNETPSIRYAQFVGSVDSACARCLEDDWVVYTINSVFRPMDLPDDLRPALKEHNRMSRRRLSSALEKAEDVGRASRVASCNALTIQVRPPAPPQDLGAKKEPSTARIRYLHDAAQQPVNRESDDSSGAATANADFATADDFIKSKGQQSSMGSFAAEDEDPSSTVGNSKQSQLDEDPNWWESFRMNFNYFVSTLRAKSSLAAQLEDTDMYILFRYFDADRDGHVVLHDMLDLVSLHIGGYGDDDDESSSFSGTADEVVMDSASPKAKKQGGSGANQDASIVVSGGSVSNFAIKPNKASEKERWLYPTVLMLQRFFLFERHRDMRRMFHYMDRDHDGAVNLEDFCHTIKKLNRIISRPIEDSQIEVMFHAITGSKDAHALDLNDFLTYFAVSSNMHRYARGSLSSSVRGGLEDTISVPQQKTLSLTDGWRKRVSDSNAAANSVTPLAVGTALLGDGGGAPTAIPMPLPTIPNSGDEFDIQSPQNSEEEELTVEGGD